MGSTGKFDDRRVELEEGMFRLKFSNEHFVNVRTSVGQSPS